MPNEVDEPDPSPLDQDQLRTLREGPLPPVALENRVISALRDQGAFARKGLLRRRAWAVAAGIALVAAGWAVGRFQPEWSNVDGGPRFLMLLERGTTPAHLEADEELRRRKEYARWANGVSGSGRILQGERLEETGKLLAARDEIRWDLGADRAQGFFVLTAVDIQHAVEIAQSCPHLKYGGRIEIRQIGSP